MAGILEEPTKRCLHKNKIYFPMENYSIASLLHLMAAVNTLYLVNIWSISYPFFFWLVNFDRATGMLFGSTTPR